MSEPLSKLFLGRLGKGEKEWMKLLSWRALSEEEGS